MLEVYNKITSLTKSHMETTFFQKNLSMAEEGQFVDYVNQKTDAIAALLTKFAEDAQIFKASIEKFDKHDAYQVELSLVLPAKTIVATEASHHITKAVDLSKDRLIIQLKKHMAALRKDRAHKSIRKESIKANEKIFIEELVQ